MNDVVLNKAASIERCIKRIREVYDHNPDNLNDFTKQDSIILNIQRACEQCIDIAMHIVSERKLGIPKSSREAFKLMQDAGILDEELADRMMRMVGFRNTAVHAYQSLNLDILKTIIERHLDDFKRFAQTALKPQ
jgi:uncharacterized protein YutE (UPF0331/DUF86 family)